MFFLLLSVSLFFLCNQYMGDCDYVQNCVHTCEMKYKLQNRWNNAVKSECWNVNYAYSSASWNNRCENQEANQIHNDVYTYSFFSIKNIYHKSFGCNDSVGNGDSDDDANEDGVAGDVHNNDDGGEILFTPGTFLFIAFSIMIKMCMFFFVFRSFEIHPSTFIIHFSIAIVTVPYMQTSSTYDVLSQPNMYSINKIWINL